MSETLVTYFSSPRSNIALTVSLDKVLSDFTNGAYSSHVLRVRKILKQDGSDAYKEAKKSLPAIAFCGEFYGGHAKSNLIKYNNLVVFDIDHLTDDEMKHTYDQLVSENIVMAFWVSPSGNGYKGLLKVKFKNIPKSAVLDDCYKKAYADAIAYFMHKYGIQLDSSCSDYSRMCYVCSDNHLFYRENAEIFNIDCSELMVSGNKSGLSKNRLDGIQNSVKSK